MAKTVLIVEDEMLIALDMQSCLEELGHTAVFAASIAEGVAAVDSIDIAILDFHVGRQDTSELAGVLHAKGKPFIVCSGSMLDEMGDVFRGAVRLEKPFRSEDLSTIISGILVSDGSVTPAS